MHITRILGLHIFLLCPLLYAAGRGEGNINADDIQKIKQVHEKYRQAWLAGDANAVRAVFVDEPVLLPHHGDPPRVGHEQLNSFWFPPGAPPTKVVSLDLTHEEIGGSGNTAYVWGTNAVSWILVQDGRSTTVSNKGTYLNVMRRLPNGEWKISHHMWDDPAPQR